MNSGYVYQCSAGEMFDSIAMNIYGSESYACDLINANPQYASRIVFDGTEQLIIPIVYEDTQTETAVSRAPWKE